MKSPSTATTKKYQVLDSGPYSVFVSGGPLQGIRKGASRLHLSHISRDVQRGEKPQGKPLSEGSQDRDT